MQQPGPDPPEDDAQQPLFSERHEEGTNAMEADRPLPPQPPPAAPMIDEDEEEECRVCRGPAEEGHPLFKPCKCSGSIGLVHQDCLESWLAIQRGDGRCELCKTKFRFAPRYADNAPDQLPTFEVLLGFLRSVLARWLPFWLRVLLAASLWLLVAPLITAYLYHGWMHKPSAVTERIKWDLIPGDLVSGAVIVAIIIFSFLSLMSFADFLRVEWQQHGLVQGARPDRQRHRNDPAMANGGYRGDAAGAQMGRGPLMPPAEEDIDNGIWEHVQQQILAQPRRLRPRLVDVDPSFRLLEGEDGAVAVEDDVEDDQGGDNNEVVAVHPPRENGAAARHQQNEPLDFGNDDMDWSDIDADTDDTDFENADEDDDDEDEEDDDLQPALRQEARHVPLNDEAQREAEVEDENEALRRINVPQNENRFDPQQDLDQDDPVDVDINIALDELLGVRGPLSAVVRNLLWLLAFNTVYLAFFAFAPRVLGTAMISILFSNSTSLDVHVEAVEASIDEASVAQNQTFPDWTMVRIFTAIEEESASHNTTFRLRDFLTVTMGYASCAMTMILLRSLWMLSKRSTFLSRATRGRTEDPDGEEIRDAFDEMERIAHGFGNDMGNMDEAPGVAIGVAVGVALDAMMAIVKVGVLLFLKMFLLPVVLGICLDLSTFSLLRGELEDRILYAGRDLFSFLLLHWVAGITFMLLVTVSVLQLREVTHPDLLGQIIRPQEPQPDLMGNLMHESVGTHAKRLVLSLVIYAFLLVLQVDIPVRIALATGWAKQTSIFDLHFSYILMPQLQVPIELLIFHLCMLALLEKNKNSIGELQHHWLKHLCGWMGFTECMLPQRIEGFRLVGQRQVFIDESSVDPFWYQLLKSTNTKREEILADTALVATRTEVREGETKDTGERVVKLGADFIRLPEKLPGRALRSKSVFLPTKAGRYRLCRNSDDYETPVIELWEEVRGVTIPRPPEGWDDLGAGGADVQGRWAWDSERKSTIEEGVARRELFYGPHHSTQQRVTVLAKFFFLIILSWTAATVMIFFLLASPLAVGRLVFHLFRVPSDKVHDPFGFAIGCLLFFPLLRRVTIFIMSSRTRLVSRFFGWVSSFRPPTTRKAVVLLSTSILSFSVIPLTVGVIYHIGLVKPRGWFTQELSFPSSEETFLSLCLGWIVCLIWSYCCSVGLMTRQFWTGMLAGRHGDAGGQGPAARNEADAAAAAWMPTRDQPNRLALCWQGRHGRVARFWNVWNAVIVHWDWDEVDSAILLQDFCFPLCSKLAILLIIPLLFMSMMQFLNCGEFWIVWTTRSTLLISLLCECCVLWQDQMSSWFEAIHKTARDEQYLVGQILLNYGETENQASG